MELNKLYEKEEIKSEINSHFEEQGFIQLQSIFNDNFTKFKNKLLKDTNKEIYKPNHISCFQLNDSTTYDPEILMFLEYFKSKEFTSFLEEITDFSLTPQECKIKRYTHKNYILLNDKTAPQEDAIDVIFDLSDEFPQGSGGIQVYTTQSEEVLYLEPTYNNLTILYRPKELLSYLKYINNLAKGKNILRVEMKFTLID